MGYWVLMLALPSRVKGSAVLWLSTSSQKTCCQDNWLLSIACGVWLCVYLFYDGSACHPGCTPTQFCIRLVPGDPNQGIWLNSSSFPVPLPGLLRWLWCFSSQSQTLRSHTEHVMYTKSMHSQLQSKHLHFIMRFLRVSDWLMLTLVGWAKGSRSEMRRCRMFEGRRHQNAPPRPGQWHSPTGSKSSLFWFFFLEGKWQTLLSLCVGLLDSENATLICRSLTSLDSCHPYATTFQKSCLSVKNMQQAGSVKTSAECSNIKNLSLPSESFVYSCVILEARCRIVATTLFYRLLV